jgi:hypothetical protein
MRLGNRERGDFNAEYAEKRGGGMQFRAILPAGKFCVWVNILRVSYV